MARVALVFALFAAALGSSAIQKVIDMLNNMAMTAKEEKHDEKIAYAEFGTWCTEKIAMLKSDIDQAGREITALTTDIGKLEDETKNLGKDIERLDRDVSQHDASIEAEKSQRAADHADFLAEHKDFAESVDALDRAIAVLEKQNYDRTQAGAMLLQLSNRLPEQARSVVVAFTQLLNPDADFSGYVAPEANGYEFQSSGVVDMLKKLSKEFRAKLAQTNTEEQNNKHASSMVIGDLTSSIKHKKVDMDEKTIRRQSKLGETAQQRKRLAATQSSKQEDEATLRGAQVECEEKGLSFGEKQQLRQEEIAAIEKAVEILSSGDVSAGAQHLRNGAASSFAQLRSSIQSEGVRRHVREFISSEGRRLHSKSLALLAEKLAGDPFAKVKQLIDQMITRLLNEANQDAEHQGWCTKEMGTSKITRDRLTNEINNLDSSIENTQARIMDMTAEVESLTAEIAELVKAMKEAIEMRVAEKAANAATVKDATAAQASVEAAISVLKEFYAKAGQATALIQVPQNIKFGSQEWQQLANPNFVSDGGGLGNTGITGTDLAVAGPGQVDTGHKAGMQTFGKTYSGQQDEAGGVLALLEVVQSDFARVRTDTKASETAAANAHDEFVADTDRNIATKNKNVEMNKQDLVAANAKLTLDTADLKTTQDELLAAERYHAKLVPQCIDKGMTYEEMMAARAEEIKSLKQALKILSNPDVASVS